MMPGGKFLLVMGTRPEVIKLAPVYFALREAGVEEVGAIITGQQPDLVQQALDIFDLDPFFRLKPGGDTLSEQMARMMSSLPLIFTALDPDFVVVQGDTTSAMTGALSAFYSGIKVAHVEAGLMTGDLDSPFPEEGHRRMISQIATLNFAPTPTAKANLQELGASGYHVVGNTVVDALEMIPRAKPEIDGRYVLVTLHRRESFGEKLRDMLKAIDELSKEYDAVQFVFSVHPNPNVKVSAFDVLDNVSLLDPPPDYGRWVNLMRGAYFIMTDSGGIQEEAPSFGVPVLVLRDKTERPEAVYRGYSQLVGTDPDQIYEEASRLLEYEHFREKMVAKTNPYGDGQAGQRIAKILMEAVIERERILQAV